MIQSMTAFASLTGAIDGTAWNWDMRSVNARGLDLRLRLPDGIDGVESALRGALTTAFARGNISVTLRLTSNPGDAPLHLDPAQLDRVLAAFDQVQERAFAMGVTLGQPSAADVLAQPGVVVQAVGDDNTGSLVKALLAGINVLVADLAAMRRAEGEAIRILLRDQIAEIDRLTGAAANAAMARQAEAGANLTAALKRVMADITEVDPDRIAQELAVLAVKSDVNEELDRLRAHAAAARALLDDPGPAGRKLDFLAQEFNREANTLCSKAGSVELTRIGLDLKAVIDQFREHVQNVE